MRIPARYLPNTVTLEAYTGPQPRGGRTYAAPVNVAAVVVAKSSRRIDARPDSETNGQEVTTSAHIVVDFDAYVPPGSRVTIHAGTPAAQVVQVVEAGYYRHPSAPESAQLWTA